MNPFTLPWYILIPFIFGSITLFSAFIVFSCFIYFLIKRTREAIKNVIDNNIINEKDFDIKFNLKK